MSSGRLEDRTPIGSLGQLEIVGNPRDSECAWIENISVHGARVISRRRWRFGDRLLITSRCPPFRSTIATVMYCETLMEGLYAIGCETPEGGVIQMLEHWTPSLD
jgi:hypothetical protein